MSIKTICLFALIITMLIAAKVNAQFHQMSSASALFLGILISLVLKSPYEELAKKITSPLLAWSIVGLGFGVNLKLIVSIGLTGAVITFLSIILCLCLGLLLNKVLHTPRKISLLITFGTAICGGSAIAVLSPMLRTKQHDTSIALAIVFVLNALALFVFPLVGHHAHFSENQFGLWAALAIHDTSSVVGTTVVYGPQALAVGTTIKLMRALWIIPFALVISTFYHHRHVMDSDDDNIVKKTKKPWFILGFILASLSITWVPTLSPLGGVLNDLAKQSFMITLFFIGSQLSLTTLKTIGLKPLAHGILLWIMMASVTYFAVLMLK